MIPLLIVAHTALSLPWMTAVYSAAEAWCLR
jgi:hypothetical protein